jgi:GTP-binding protein
MGRNRTGAKGADVVLKVPVGTQIFEEDNETLIADLTEVGQRVVLARAAMAASATSISRPRPTRRRAAPIPARKARRSWIWLRLKLIADAGLVGLPNAGKSTFLAASPRPSRRSPTIRSRRCIRPRRRAASTAANSCWPTFPA